MFSMEEFFIVVREYEDIKEIEDENSGFGRGTQYRA